MESRSLTICYVVRNCSLQGSNNEGFTQAYFEGQVRGAGSCFSVGKEPYGWNVELDTEKSTNSERNYQSPLVYDSVQGGRTKSSSSFCGKTGLGH